MGTNTLAGTGLQFSRNLNPASPDFQGNYYSLLSTYSTSIGVGDVVATGTAGNLGYAILAADGATSLLGVCMGFAPYFDTGLQQVINPKYWRQTSSPATGASVNNPAGAPQILVADNQSIIFQAQLSGVTWSNGYRGKNVDWKAGTNGAPSTYSGLSTLYLDGTTINTTNTLPFRIVGLAQTIIGGPQDPSNTNPIIEVQFNPGSLENLQSTGI